MALLVKAVFSVVQCVPFALEIPQPDKWWAIPTMIFCIFFHIAIAVPWVAFCISLQTAAKSISKDMRIVSKLVPIDYFKV